MQLQLNECKSCGGSLRREGNHYVCQSCGNKWIIDAAEDVHVVDRANAWAALRNGDFDQAAELFETIHLKEPKDHEAYWGLALACAGILYVVDYEEHKRVPTCNNISEDSFVESKNVKKAIELAPSEIGEGYRHQAEQIEQIRLEWLQKARKEPPYDIFLSYKDSDREHGIDRTQDSVDAQDLYNMLTAEGYKVFFSRISLRDKVSEHYEPYIYNALKTAKVMIVFGEKPEYFNATWVKNEWSRFKKRIEDGEKHKNSLVVVCKNMNPGDLPVVLKSRQCLNAADITFGNDLLRHIEKVIALSKGDEHLEKIKIQGGQISKKATSLTKNDVKKREIGQGAVAKTSIDEKKSLSLVESYIKEKQWEDAGKLLENVLFSNPSFAEAIWCKLMIAQKVSSNAALVKTLDRFKPEDYALIEKSLNCASKEFAGKILDLLYESAKSLPTNICEKLYHLILPYRYERRAVRLKESFDWCISKREFTLFKLLLTALESEDVDDYIEYNSRYIQSTLDHAEKRECTENILTVDEGNRFARMYIFESELASSSDLKSISDSFENVLKYSENMDGDVLEALVMVTGMLGTSVHCKFAKQLLKYHTGELRLLREPIITLANRMIEKSFFDDAQYFFNVLLSIDPDDADAFWGICLAKTNSTSESQIVNSPLLLNAQAEYNKYLSLVGEERRVVCMRLAKKQQQVQKSKRRKKIRVTIFITAAALAIIAAVLSVTVIIPSMKMKEANELFDTGDYEEAIKLYQSLNGFGDSSERAETVKAIFQVEAKQYDSAVRTLLSLGIPVEITYETDGGYLADNQALVLGHTLSLDAAVIPLGNAARAGTGETTTQTYTNSANFAGIPTPERNGYRFVEWQVETYEYDINSEDSVFYLTLKATWSEKEYVIEYDLAGGAVPEGTNPAEYGIEDDAFTLVNPTREGYVFLGWTGTDLAEPTLEVTISSGSFGDRTYTANWMANEWTWELDVNGGNCDVTELTVTYDAEYTLPVPTWEGHIFLGWYLREDMSLVESGVCQVDSALSLVAQWEKIEYTITYELNGGVVSGENPEVYDYDSTFPLIAPTRRGYTFLGWQLNGEGDRQTEVTVPQGSIGDRVYTAAWSAIKSTVTLNANGGSCSQSQVSVEFDKTLSLPTPHWEGHTFSGWYVSGTKVTDGENCELTESCTLVAQWDAISYTITYVLNGGTNAAKNPSTYTYHDEVALRHPQRYGYTFLGWTYAGQDTPVTEVTIPETTTGNKTYTAHWEAISSRVTLDAAGGSCDVTGFDVTYDGVFTLPTPEWVGHEFVGWYAADTLVMAGTSWMYDADMTLTARWDAIEYTITYHLDGGENAIVNPDIYTYHDAFTLAAPTRVGYTFLGWTYEGQNTPTLQVTISAGTIGDKEYTAHWVANGYVVTLQPNGGQVETGELVVTFDEEYTLPTPTRPGYTFTGWYLGDELVENGVWTRVEDVTLTAAWAVNTYSVTLENVRDHRDFLNITFDSNYVGGERNEVTLTNGEALPQTYQPTTRDGYLFGGWYTNAACDGAMYSFTENLTEDLILYAKWLPIHQQAEGILVMNGSTGQISVDSNGMHYFAFLSLIDQNVTLYTSHSGGDPVLELYDENMDYLSSDDDGYGDRDARIIWPVSAGRIYYVAIRDYNSGNASIHLSGSELPGGGVAEVGQLSGWLYADGYDHVTNVQFDSEISLPTPSRVGYSFEGWYLGDELVESGLWQIPNDVVLVASWRPLSYTLTFDANGGTMDSDTMEVFYDSAYTLPIPTRSGYSFAGWYCDGNLVENGVWTSTESISLVGRWTENTYSIMLDDLYRGIAITYNENYTGASVYRRYYAQGDTLVYPDAPVRDGYLFTGWYTTAACERLYDFTSSVSENVTLYAGWVEPSRDYNGIMSWGGSFERISFVDDEMKYFAFVPLKSQWVTFYTTHTSGDPVLYLYDAYGGQQAWDEDSAGDLNARFNTWVQAGSVYYVALSLRESGTGSIYMESAEFPNAGGSVNMSSDHWQPRPGYDHTIQIVFGYTYTLPELTRDGYEFAGWYNGDTLMDLSGTWNIPSDVVLVPHWVANTYTVTLDPNSGSVENDSAEVTFDEIVSLPTPTKTGYVFQGWYYGEVRVDGALWTYLQDATLVARWAASDDVQYTVHHYLQNLENNEYTFFESTIHTGTADAEIWAVVGSYAGFVSPAATLITVNADGSTEISYYYDRSVVHVTLAVNGGDWMEIISLKYGEEFTLPDATRTGYTFGGWFVDAALTVPFASTTVPNEDTTLYAWWTEENKPGDFAYTVEDVVIIDGYTGEGTTITVPSHIGGYIVRSVSTGAFANLSEVTRIEIPMTVTSLGEGAFEGCTALEELVLPFIGVGNSGYSYENDATNPWIIAGSGQFVSSNHGQGSSSTLTFTALYDMEMAIEYRTSSESGCDRVVISLNGGALWEQSGTYTEYTRQTVSLVAGDTLQFVYQKDGSVDHGDDCAYIRLSSSSQTGLGAIFGQTELEGTVGIVQGDVTYYLPESLTSVTCTGSSLSAGAFANCTTLEEIHLPNLVYLGEGAFENCSALTKLNSDVEGQFVLGAGVTQIPARAFLGCTGMESMTVEGVVTTVGERAFYGCTSLASFGSDVEGQMILPEGLITIEKDAFRGLTAITDVVVPDSVTTIGMGAFGGCNALESITLPFIGRSENEGSAQNRVLGYIFGDGTPDDDTLDMSDTIFVTSGEEGFTSQIQNGDQYYYYAIPASLRHVSVTRQTRMYSYMFRNCDSITHLDLPEQLVTIDEYAFQNMAALQSIVVPNSVTSIGNGAFMGCNSLVDVTIPFVGIYNTTSQNGWDFVFGYIFGNSTQEQEGMNAGYYRYYYIPQSIRNVTVTMQTYVPNYAFYNCNFITNITIPTETTRIGLSAFYGCTNLSMLNSNTAGTFHLPASLTYIEDYAFFGCSSMTALVTGDVLTDIDPYAFSGCTALNRINSDEAGVANLPSSLLNIRSYAFENVATPTTLVVPNSVVRIEIGAFKGWNALMDVTIPFVGIINANANGQDYVFGYIFGYDNNAQEGTTAQYYKYYYIPQTIKNVTVTLQTYMPNYAFYNCNFIETITVPDTVTRIGNYTFADCTKLSKLNSDTAGVFNLPAALTYIEDYAFSGCAAMTTLVTGDALVTIDLYAFANCSKLATVTLGNAVQTIENHAFANCVALSKVNSATDKMLTLPGSVKYIRDYAFENAGLMTKLLIPDTVEYIGRGAFKGCNALVDVTLPFIGMQNSETANNWQYVFGYIFDTGSNDPEISVNQEHNWYLIPKTIKTVTITKQIGIPAYAFSGCSFIETITISGEPTRIGMHAFMNCSALSKLNSDTAGTFNIPASVTYIDDYAFSGCAALTTLVTGDALVTIDPYAFANCSKLATVTLGSSVASINDHAFYNCVALNKVNSDADKTLTFPSSVKTIGGWAFENAGLITKLIVPDSVETIGQGAFLGCNALVEVTLPFIGVNNSENANDWQHVFGYIFDRGEQNAKVSVNQEHDWYLIPKTIKTVTITKQTGIPAYAFSGCSFIETITISGEPTRIGLHAFMNCSALSKLNSDTAGTFHIPDSVTYIDDYAFSGCTALTTLVTGDALVTIDPRAFENCSKLATVTLGSAVENIRDHVFYNCVALNKVNSTTDKTLTLPDSVKVIGEYAFENAGLITTLVIPDSVQIIERGAFYGCNALVNVTIPFIGYQMSEGANRTDSVFGYIFNYGGNEAAGCVNQYHNWYYIPKTIRNVTVTKQTNIPLNAFRNCDFIETITLPEETTVIGAHAFYGCKKLSKLNSNAAGTFKLPDGVAVLNENVFYDCDALITFIPSSTLETIGTRAFYGCDNLVKFNTTQNKTVVIPNTVKTIGTYAFENVFHVTNLVIPDNVTEILEGAFKGWDSLKSMTLPFVGRTRISTGRDAVLGYIFGWGGGTVTQHYQSSTAVFYIPAITSVTITDQTKIPYGAFSGITTLKTVNLREDTETIGDYAFYGCTSLTGTNLGDNLISIGNRAFENCSALVSIELPETLTTIGQYAFSGCVKLNRINSDEANTLNLPDGLGSIDSHAFCNLSTVKKIIVPDSVTAIGLGAFNGCSNLVEITLPFVGSEDKCSTPRFAVFGYIFGDNTPTDTNMAYSSTIYNTSSNDQGFTSQYVYSGSSYYYFAIPKTLRTVTVTRQTSIPDYAFKNCDLLETINLPVGATVAETAMENCSATVNTNVNSVTAPAWDGQSVADGFASGTGTQGDPFIIFTPEQLVYLAQQVNAGNSYENVYFALSGDIILSGSAINLMTVIGNSEDTPFAGHIDGRSHVIRNFNITGTADDLAIGLFGYVSGSVKNLGVERATFTSQGTTLEVFAGGLVAYLTETGVIENCYSTASVTVTGVNEIHVGGLVGYNAGTIRNSYACGNVSATSNTDAYVGGFVANNEGVIVNCFAYGGVTAHGRNEGASYSGGFVAVMAEEATLTNCYRNEAQYLKHYETEGAASCDLGTAASNAEIRAILMAEGSAWAELVWDFSTMLPRFK